ncbi:MAG: hypothetical protein GW802_37725 [Armatimonadetes bacterium]|nr:hypothetical protein [Armatimonadota bacterium]
MMMKARLLVSGLLVYTYGVLSVPAPEARAEPTALSWEEALVATHELLDMEYRYWAQEEDFDRRRLLIPAFEASLLALGSRMGDDVAERAAASRSPDVRVRLLATAHYVAHRPDRYADLADYYGRAASVRTHLPRARPLREEHATEEYCLVWEYMLLRPPGPGPALYLDRAFEALERIGNPASIVVLLHLHRIGCATVGYSYRMVLATVGRFATPQGLRAILSFLAQAPQEAATGKPYYAWGTAAERQVLDVLAGEYGNTDKWRKLLADFKEHLPSDEQRLLEEARRLAAGPTTATN